MALHIRWLCARARLVIFTVAKGVCRCAPILPQRMALHPEERDMLMQWRLAAVDASRWCF
jgi:hypothetical protein